jgi:hypothetical protein
VSIILQNLAMLIWGRQYVSFPPILPRDQHEFLGAHITDLQIFIVVLAFSIMAGLWLLVERTRLGRAMRATAQSREVAELMGVNVDRVISATFVIGAAIAAIAGVMVSAYYGLAHYYMGFMLGPEGVFGGGAGRHRQHRRGHAGRLAAGRHRGAGRRLHRRHHRRFPGQPLSGRVRFLRADCRAGVPTFRTAWRTGGEAVLEVPAQAATPDGHSAGGAAGCIAIHHGLRVWAIPGCACSISCCSMCCSPWA